MKRNILALIFVGILCSCSIKTIHYSYNFRTIYKGIDFTQQQGNWLLNSVNLPERNKEKILSKFNKWTKNKTTLTSKMIDKQGAKVGGFFSNPLTAESLKFIKEITNYKYLINVYLLKNQNSTPQITITEMVLDIHDITNNNVILSEIVTASMHHEQTTDIGDIHGFRVSVEPNMIDGLVKKGLKKIGKNSIY